MNYNILNFCFIQTDPTTLRINTGQMRGGFALTINLTNAAPPGSYEFQAASAPVSGPSSGVMSGLSLPLRSVSQVGRQRGDTNSAPAPAAISVTVAGSTQGAGKLERRRRYRQKRRQRAQQQRQQQQQPSTSGKPQRGVGVPRSHGAEFPGMRSPPPRAIRSARGRVVVTVGRSARRVFGGRGLGSGFQPSASSPALGRCGDEPGSGRW
jgi:hypothetical protein